MAQFFAGSCHVFLHGGQLWRAGGRGAGRRCVRRFWMLMVNEKSRLIGATIANEIQEAITETTEAESIIEIKRMRSGIIARVYLICSRDKAALVNRAVARRMEQCVFKKYLWVMQLTNMAGRGDLREMQRILNEQLLEELLRNHREDE